MPDAPAGFAEFVAGRQAALLRTAWLLTGDWASAEDLVQTALARCWPRWERIRSDDPEAYVRRVLVTIHAGWWRRRWRGERPAAEVPDRPAAGDVADEVAMRVAVAAALGRLTRRQRAVVVLRVFEDLPEAQVADLLGCAVGTVKATTSQAVAKLRSDPQVAGMVGEVTP